MPTSEKQDEINRNILAALKAIGRGLTEITANIDTLSDRVDAMEAAMRWLE